MNKAVENLLKAQQYAMSIRPKVGGFPYLAEALRKAGVVQKHLEPSLVPEYFSHTPRSRCKSRITPFERDS